MQIVEYACGQCGAEIPAAAVTAAEYATVDEKPSYMCARCGYTTPFARARAFQWYHRLRATTRALCTVEELRLLRIAPAKFLNEVLNSRLLAQMRPPFELDMSTIPPTIREVGRARIARWGGSDVQPEHEAQLPALKEQ